MELYVMEKYHGTFVRFLNSFFVHAPLEVWFRFITAYWPTSADFVNYSDVSDAELQQQWALAQQGLATAPFPLNDAGGDMQKADARALLVKPKHVTVISVPDVSIADLMKIDAAWAKDKDPSGAILQLIGLEYTTCHSFACCWKKPRVYAAQSKIPVTLAYEFENVILSELGYNVSNR
jgi:hypothetical protein